MTIAAALAEIATFRNYEPLPSAGSSDVDHVARLQDEFAFAIPEELKTYIREFTPAPDLSFDTVGNPMRVYGLANLKRQQDGYNFNSLTGKRIEGWPESYFIFADEGADPVVIDLEHPEYGIAKLRHGAGSWAYGETVADTIGQFLLCSAALHHALNGFDEEPIIDDEQGFNLAPLAANWYFGKMKTWAGDYYESWCSAFENS